MRRTYIAVFVHMLGMLVLFGCRGDTTHAAGDAGTNTCPPVTDAMCPPGCDPEPPTCIFQEKLHVTLGGLTSTGDASGLQLPFRRMVATDSGLLGGYEKNVASGVRVVFQTLDVDTGELGEERVLSSEWRWPNDTPLVWNGERAAAVLYQRLSQDEYAYTLFILDGSGSTIATLDLDGPHTVNGFGTLVPVHDGFVLLVVGETQGAPPHFVKVLNDGSVAPSFSPEPPRNRWVSLAGYGRDKLALSFGGRGVVEIEGCSDPMTVFRTAILDPDTGSEIGGTCVALTRWSAADPTKDQYDFGADGPAVTDPDGMTLIGEVVGRHAYPSGNLDSYGAFFTTTAPLRISLAGDTNVSVTMSPYARPDAVSDPVLDLKPAFWSGRHYILLQTGVIDHYGYAAFSALRPDGGLDNPSDAVGTEPYFLGMRAVDAVGAPLIQLGQRLGPDDPERIAFVYKVLDSSINSTTEYSLFECVPVE